MRVHLLPGAKLDKSFFKIIKENANGFLCHFKHFIPFGYSFVNHSFILIFQKNNSKLFVNDITIYLKEERIFSQQNGMSSKRMTEWRR